MEIFLFIVGPVREIEINNKLALFFGAVFAYLFFITPSAGAIWSSGVTISDLPQTPSPFSNGNIECSYGSYKSQYIFKESYINSTLTYGEQTYEGVGRSYDSICMAQNAHGLVSVTNNLWAQDVTSKQVLPIDAGPYFVTPSPGGTAILISGPVSPSGSQYSINHSLSYLGALSTKTYGTGVAARREKIWQIDTGKLEPFLQYNDGSIVRIDQVGFSSNGKYMIVQLSRRGYARINLETKELTPFFITTTLNNGIGVFLGVSNDGNSAAVSKAGTGLFSVFDLANCQQKFQFGAWPAIGDLPVQGCVQTNLFTSLQANTPSASSATGLQFSPNGSELSIYVGFTDAGVPSSKRVKFKASSYTSNASGYLAMGDSYSSGEGDGDGRSWYESGTDEQGDKSTFAGRNLCHLSRRSYPYLLAIEAGYLANNTASPPTNGSFHSVACSGAKIHNVLGLVGEKQNEGTAVDFSIMDNQYRFDKDASLNIWQPGASKQINYMQEFISSSFSRASFDPEVITLSIGGNDVGFGKKVAACLMPGECEFATSEQKRSDMIIEIAAQKKRLESTYKKIKQDAPDAVVYVIGYPQFVEKDNGECNVNALLTTAERHFIVEATGYMNDVIESATKATGVVYVDIETILEGANLCSGAEDSIMAVNGVTAGNDVDPKGLCTLRDGCLGSESFHPNQRGHERYTDEIRLKTNGLTLRNPAPVPSSYPAPSDYFGFSAKVYIEALNSPNAPELQYPAFQEMIANMTDYRQPLIKADGLLPYSKVKISIHSDPISLGEYTVGADGSLSKTVTIPSSLAGGYHEIHLSGITEFGRPVELYEPVLLAESEDDFDGDGFLNETDSCPAVTNSGIDIDVDGIDDVCDSSAIAPVPEETPIIPVVEEEEVPEEPIIIEEEIAVPPEQPVEPPITEPEPIDNTDIPAEVLPEDIIPVEELPLEVEEEQEIPQEEIVDNEENSIDDEFVEDVDKGVPSPETVAGNEQIAQTGVLGTSTVLGAAQSAVGTLVQTGKSQLGGISVGFGLLAITIIVAKSTGTSKVYRSNKRTLKR